MDNGDFIVEGIRHYQNYRNNNGTSCGGENFPPPIPYGKCGWIDLDYCFNITNAVSATLKAAGYPRKFYYVETDAWAEDLLPSNQGGLDNVMADDVDLFFFAGHSYDDVTDGNGATIVFDSNHDQYSSSSKTWDLGNRDLEWLGLYTCDVFKHLIDPNNTSTLKADRIWPNYGNIFNGLHLILASYGKMFFGSSQSHIGQSFAENLMDGDSIKSAWLDATGVDNSPGVLSAERIETWNDGHPDWPNTTMENDHYWGRGNVKPDIPRSEIGWLGFWWRYKT
jgi:Family of unknown function (DUF6345)